MVIKITQNRDVVGRALERGSDASLQALILLDVWLNLYPGSASLDQLYNAGSHYIRISKHALWKCFYRAEQKGLVKTGRVGAEENNPNVGYSLTDDGKVSVNKAREIGKDRRDTWGVFLSLKDILSKGDSDD